MIEKATNGVTTPRKLPRAWLKGSDDFSFSGLKTATLHMTRELGISEDSNDPASRQIAQEIAAGFQESVVDVLVSKTTEAARRHGATSILLAGGVAANSALRLSMQKRAPVPVIIPGRIHCTDNAAMIAACGYYKMKAGQTSGWDLDVKPGLKLV